jgi:hypothetical protein
MYILKAHTSAFADTFNDPIKSVFTIAQSSSWAKLKEIMALLEDKSNPTVKAMRAFEDSDTFYSVRHTDSAEMYFDLETSFGSVLLRYFPLDRYYGPGSLDYFEIEGGDDGPPEYVPPTV